MQMTAVAETAPVNERLELTKTSGNLVGIHMPETELTNTGRVDTVAATGEMIEPCIGCGVAPFAHLLGKLADADRFVRQQRLNERRFAYTGLPHKNADTGAQNLTQRLQPHTRVHGSEYNRISQCAIRIQKRMQRMILCHKVSLV